MMVRTQRSTAQHVMSLLHLKVQAPLSTWGFPVAGVTPSPGLDPRDFAHSPYGASSHRALRGVDVSRVQQILEERDRRLRLAQLRQYGDNIRAIQRVAASLPAPRSPQRQSGGDKQEAPGAPTPKASTDRNSFGESHGGRSHQRRA